VIKFLAALLGVVSKMLGAWTEHRSKQQGRKDTIKEFNDAINEQVALGEAVLAVPDATRDDRLRSRFDRSRK